MNRETDSPTPTIEEVRIRLWRAALLASIHPDVKQVVWFIYDPLDDEERIEEIIGSIARTPLQRAALRVLMEEIAWESSWAVTEVEVTP